MIVHLFVYFIYSTDNFKLKKINVYAKVDEIKFQSNPCF